jgi:tight adherence protein C
MIFASHIFTAFVFSLSAFFLVQSIWEWNERRLAKERAMGQSLSKDRLKLKMWRQALSSLHAEMALKVSAILPGALKAFLEERLAKAAMGGNAGALASDALLLGTMGLLISLFLGLDGYSLFGALLGASLPMIRLSDAAAKREKSLRKDLPDALDLLTTCVEAGLGFDQALSRVTSRMRAGALRRELESCVASMSLGQSRRDALKELDHRARLEELGQVVAALVQSDKRGIPLAATLRAQSAQLRVLRSLRVKKLAAEAPLKMLFPLMAFILPVVFIVLFGPIYLKWSSGGL